MHTAEAWHTVHHTMPRTVAAAPSRILLAMAVALSTPAGLAIAVATTRRD